MGYQQTSGRNLKVSDDGMMAVPDLEQPKEFFADPSVIAEANRRLTKVQSMVELYTTSTTQTVRVPGTWIGLRELPQVLPRLVNTVVPPGQEYAVEFEEECFRLANMIMGNTAGAQGADTRAGRFGQGTGQNKVAMNYDALVQSGTQLHGQAAQPKVGQAFATFSSGQMGTDHWNFHFAGVVARSGPDAVALENYTRKGEIANAALAFAVGLRGVRDDLLNAISDNIHSSSLPPRLQASSLLEVLAILPALSTGERNEVANLILGAAKSVNTQARTADKFLQLPAGNTLWYFKMYGSPNTAVGGWTGTTPQDQTYHAAQAGTPDFAAPETTSVRKT